MTSPQLEDVLEAWLRAETLEWHTALPGRVVDYDPATETVTVEPLIARAVAAVDAAGDETGAVEAEPRPQLPAVPVVYVGSAHGRTRTDPRPGDLVLLVACSRAIRGWVDGGSGADVVVPDGPRRFSLEDSFAFPIARRLDPGGVELDLSDGRVSLGTDTVDVVSVLADLLEVLAAATPAGGGGLVFDVVAVAQLVSKLSGLVRV